MKKRTIIAIIILVTNLIILACGNQPYISEEAPKEEVVITGKLTEVVSTNEAGELIVELQLPVATVTPEAVPTRVKEAEVTEAPAPAGNANDPIQIHNGQHTYTSQATSFDCICTEAGTVTSNFVFSGDTVSDGNNVYTNSGGNTFTRSWTGQSILVVDGKETTLEIQKHAVLIFSEKGYRLENYSDADPSSGSPCCFYEFTLEK